MSILASLYKVSKCESRLFSYLIKLALSKILVFCEGRGFFIYEEIEDESVLLTHETNKENKKQTKTERNKFLADLSFSISLILGLLYSI